MDEGPRWLQPDEPCRRLGRRFQQEPEEWQRSAEERLGCGDELLDLQAEAIGLPVIKVWIPPQCPNEVYENSMASTFAGPEFQGIDHVAFADLFLEDIRAYREGRLAQAGKRGVFPIWGRDTVVLAREMIAKRLPGHRGLRESPDSGSHVRRAHIRRTLPG